MEENRIVRPIQQRSIALSIVLSILTCGIYSLFWMAFMINDICDLKGEPRKGGLGVLLSVLTCGLYGLYLYYKMGEDLDEIKTSRGIMSSNSGLLYLILALIALPFVSTILIQDSLNKLC